MTPLYPVHHSMMKERDQYLMRAKPQGMARLPMTSEQRQAVESVALGIFTDMVNAGCTMQETLAAIYLSGMQHAVEIAGT